ncbi:MAG: hypothetical protein MUC63_06955 [Planctomycetes bacterium]|nr:hypothetical protein [Planctomycetota bacterium]
MHPSRERILAVASQRPVTFLAYVGYSDEAAGLHSAKEPRESIWTVSRMLTAKEIEEWPGG